MSWFKKKADPAPEPPKEPLQISFEYGDVPMVRAEKIWRALGFVNDRLGAIPALAGYLSMYRDWDKLPPGYYFDQKQGVKEKRKPRRKRRATP